MVWIAAVAVGTETSSSVSQPLIPQKSTTVLKKALTL